MKFTCILFCLSISLLAAEPPTPPQAWRELWSQDKWARWHAKPVDELRREAEKGNPAGMFVLAKKLRSQKTPTARAEGEQWMRKAADLEFPHAVLDVDSPKIISQEPDSMLAQLKVAERVAATGFPPAKVTLAILLANGAPIRPDLKRALTLMREAFDEGATAADFALAQFYARGLGEPRSAQENPVTLCQLAAARGEKPAIEDMIFRLRYGIGIEKDLLAEAAYRARLMADTERKSFELQRIDEVSPEPNAEVFDLFLRAVREHERADFLKLAAHHQDGKLGKVNLVRAAALFTMAGAAAQAEALKKNFNTKEKAEYEGDLRWLRGDSTN